METFNNENEYVYDVEPLVGHTYERSDYSRITIHEMKFRLRRGVTLVEILVAVAIFSLAVLVVFATYNLTLRLNQLAKEDTIAANLASEMLESYRAKAFDTIAVPVTSIPASTTKLPSGYTNITTSYYQGNSKMIQIQIKVYWVNRPIDRAFTMTTVKSLGGIND